MLDWTRNAVLQPLGAKTVGVRAVIINDRDEVLLVRHTYRDGWHTPGGGVHAGESPQAALRREVMEEVGLDLTGPPQLFNIYLHKWRGLTDYPILFVVRSFTGTARPADAQEIAEIGWFAWDRLPAQTTAKTRLRIDEVLHARPCAERW
jgi:8-oxo-dGTP pyrophosphatase MutT (NUDIX family)